MRRILLAVVFLLLLIPGGRSYTQGSGTVPFNGIASGAGGVPIPGASVAVCMEWISTVPCITTTIYQVSTTTPAGCVNQQVSNPVHATPAGRYAFCDIPGNYTIQISAPGYTTETQFITLTNGSGTSSYNTGYDTASTSFGLTGAVNGSNTTFTLASAPNPPASLLLWENGTLLYSPTQYSLSGSTITMVTAPSSSATLQAQWLSLGVPSAATIFNVRLYGATGNGTTDDTAAIQAATSAADSSAGGIVYFPAGQYKISSSITSQSLYTGFLGDGKGASAILNTGTGAAIISDPSSFAPVVNPYSILRGPAFEHILIGCNSNNGAVPASSSTTAGFLAENQLGPVFLDDRVSGCHDGIEATPPSGTWFEELHISNTFLSNNFYGVHLNGTPSNPSGNSFAYTNMEFYCEINNPTTQASGACLRADYAWLYNSVVRITANLPANGAVLGPDVIQADNFTKLGYASTTANNEITVFGEGATGQPVLAIGDAAQVPQTTLKSSVIGAVAFLTNVNPPNWAASTNYSVGSLIDSSCNGGGANGDRMMAVNAGTSGSTAPTWNCGSGTSPSLDLTTTDNNITWRNVGINAGANGGYGGQTVSVGDAGGNVGARWFVYPSVPQTSAACPNGSIFSNLAGSVGSLFYYCDNGTWVDVK